MCVSVCAEGERAGERAGGRETETASKLFLKKIASVLSSPFLTLGYVNVNCLMRVTSL